MSHIFYELWNFRSHVSQQLRQVLQKILQVTFTWILLRKYARHFKTELLVSQLTSLDSIVNRWSKTSNAPSSKPNNFPSDFSRNPFPSDISLYGRLRLATSGGQSRMFTTRWLTWNEGFAQFFPFLLYSSLLCIIHGVIDNIRIYIHIMYKYLKLVCI